MFMPGKLEYSINNCENKFSSGVTIHENKFSLKTFLKHRNVTFPKYLY